MASILELNNKHRASNISIDNSISGLYSDDTQGAIDELKGTIGYSKKNLLKYPYTDTTKTVVGVTYTDKGDGTLTLSGIATGSNSFTLVHKNVNAMTLKKGKYILSGCPKGGSDNAYSITINVDVNGVSTNIVKDYGEGVEFELEEDTLINYISIAMASGINTNGLVFKPMLRYASIKDDTYEPYVEDVQTQIDNIKNTSYEILLDGNYNVSSSSQTINIPNYQNYNMLSIRMQGDTNNGIRINIPKALYNSSTPFYIDTNHRSEGVYTFKAQGYIHNGSIVIMFSSIKGWTKLNLLVLGLK